MEWERQVEKHETLLDSGGVGEVEVRAVGL